MLGFSQQQLPSHSSWKFCPKIIPCQLTETCPFPSSAEQGWGYGETQALLLVYSHH